MSRGHVDRLPEQPTLGQWGPRELGSKITTVQYATPCPTCREPGRYTVHANGVRWPCGHTRSLPPLRFQTGHSSTRRTT